MATAMLNPLLPYLNGLGGTSHGGSERSESPVPSPGTTLPPAPPPPPLVPSSPLTDAVPDLSKELPIILNDLVPLSVLVERVIAQAYAELANLAEILPSTDDQGRKRAIVDYVLQTRRQILKLLVLVRWSAEASNVAKCMNIIGFLGRQNFEFDRTIEGLTGVKAMLGGARVRNYDIATALSVLTTGTYTRLPAALEETFAAPRRLRNEEVVRTLRDLDDVLRWRLSCVELLPFPMRNYAIADGRATFTVEGLWEASFTFGGDEDDQDAEWYLLSLKFLFRVKDARGAWASIPVGPMKDRIVELCNRQLAKRKPISNPGDLGIHPRDAPLFRAYSFLQRLALSYQLEALYAQALQLEGTLWAGHLKAELSKESDELKVEYWTPPPASKPARANTPAVPAPPPPPPPLPSGSLIISLRSRRPSSSYSTVPKARVPSGAQQSMPEKPPSIPPINARAKALEKALGSESYPENDIQERLDVVWNAEGLPDNEKAVVKLAFSSDLNLEALLRATTTVHARESIRQLFDQLVAELDPADLELVSSGAHALSLLAPTSPDVVENGPGEVTDAVVVPFIRVHLFGQHHVIASVSSLSGRLEFKAVGEVAAMRETRLRNAAEKVDKDRKVAAETLLRVRASTIVDEVDSRAVFLGFRTVRRLSLRQNDWAKFGASTRSFLFIHLPQLPLHYLVLVLQADGFHFALVSVREMTDNVQNWLAIDELGWLQKSSGDGPWDASPPAPDRDSKSQAFGFDVGIDDLRDLYTYSVRRIAFFQVEQQLHLRRIPYNVVAASPISSSPADSSGAVLAHPLPPSSSTRIHVLSASVPYLVIHSSDLLRSTADVAYPNIAIQCFLEEEVIKTTFHVRFRHLALVKPNPSDLPDCMAYDPKSSIITFTLNDIHNCVTTFLTAYSLIARSIVLARHRASQLAPAEAKDRRAMDLS